MKVSILIPVFNASPFVAKTIESALAQEWKELEIIIVDDGSSDNSLEIAKAYEHNPKIKVFSQPNSGACRARNFAFEKSTGDYIQYLDADDLLSSNKIARQMTLARNWGKEYIYSCSWERFRTSSTKLPESKTKRFLDRDWDDPLEWLCHSWEGRGMGMVSTWLCHRELINEAGPWDERLVINQDGEFFSRVLLAARGIRYSNEGLAYYRTGGSGSVSQIKSRKSAESMLLSYNLYEKHISEFKNQPQVRRALALNYCSFMYSYYGVFQDLVQKAKENANALGFKKLPVTGGRNFRILSRLLGFEHALQVRTFFRSFKPTVR